MNTTDPKTYKGDKPFKRNARTHQSDFRTNFLKVPFDPDNIYGKYGAFLMPDDANAGLNFCKDFCYNYLKKYIISDTKTLSAPYCDTT